MATHQSPWSSSIDYVERRWGEDGLPLYVEVHVTVTSGDISHSAIGDASLANVGKMIATALPRMAHTRALNRALRCLIGQGGTTAEEIPDSHEMPQDAPRARQGGSTPPTTTEAPTGPPRGEQVAQAILGEDAHQCPACGGRVWDNRKEPGRAEKNRPKWACADRQTCKGSKDGTRAWFSYDEWPKEWPRAAAPPADGEPIPPPQDGPPPWTDEEMPF
jgi:hypothetical protein